MDGHVAAGFEPVRQAFEAAQADDDGAAQLAVYRHGEPVVDVWTGRDPVDGKPFTGDSVTVLMSVTKGLVATCAHLLRERGQLDVDAPVTRYWPEFTADAPTTVADLLSHRSGRSDFDPDDGITVTDLFDWDRRTASLAAMTPLWTSGGYFKYHSLTWGYLAGEVIRRVAGRSVGRFFATEVAAPLGLDLWISLPTAEDHRFVPQFAPYPPFTPEQLGERFSRQGLDVTDRLVRATIDSMVLGGQCVDALNSPAGRAAEVPAAGGIGNARALARMYAATIGAVDGVRLLAPDTVTTAR